MPWELWRQDDNGNRVLVRAYDERADAERDLAAFEALGHKQIYWLDERAPAEAAGSRVRIAGHP